MIAAKRIILVLCLLFIAGCGGGQLNVIIKPNITAATNDYFTVVVAEKGKTGKGGVVRDILGIKIKLEHSLIANGFNVRETTSIPQKEDSANYYLIQCNYRTEWKTFRGGRVFIAFTATVVNLKTNEIVATADLTGYKPISEMSELIDDFVNKLSPLVKAAK